MNPPLVSILIPAYNARRWLADTIESAVRQSWPNKEIIVVDDGSADDTFAIAEQFARRGVRVERQRNQGAAAARNTAFSKCSGEFIQWLDADDLLAPDKVERQMKVALELRAPRVLLSGGWARFIHRPYKARFRPSSLWEDLTPAEWLLRKLEENLFMQTGSWLVSRELTEAAGPWDTRLLGDDDGEYFCRVLLASSGTRFVPEARIYYREAGAASLSYIGSSGRKLEAQFISSKLHIQYLLSLSDNPRGRAACLAYLQRYLPYFYPERPDIVAEANAIADRLGGKLVEPQLSWKYAWIRKLFGWGLAKRSQLHYNRAKSALIARVDQGLYFLENGKSRLPGT